MDSDAQQSLSPTSIERKRVSTMKLGRLPHSAAWVALGGLLLTGCATTKFQSTWKAPNAGPVELDGQKVAAFVLSPNDGIRRQAEDALARELDERGADGIAGYQLVPDPQDADQEAAIAAMKELGVDAIVLVHPIGRDQEVDYTPGYWTTAPYGTWSGYWGWGWGMVYEPGYTRTYTVVTIETRIYDLDDEKLVWAGVSRTLDQTRVDEIVGDISRALAKELTASGLLKG